MSLTFEHIVEVARWKLDRIARQATVTSISLNPIHLSFTVTFEKHEAMTSTILGKSVGLLRNTLDINIQKSDFKEFQDETTLKSSD